MGFDGVTLENVVHFHMWRNLEQARSQNFEVEGPGSGSQHQKGVRGCHPRKNLKNVHVIWCTLLHLLHKHH